MSLLTDPERRRWVGWFVLAGAFLLVNVYRLSTAVLATDLARAFDATAAALGSLHAAFFYVYAPLQLLAGVLADRAGIRRTAALGTLVMCGGGFLFAVAAGFPAAFAARALIGLGGSVVFIATLRYAANWYRPDEFATMSGLTVAVAGAGGIVATTPLALLVAEVGWREAVAGISVVALAVAGLVAVVVRDRPADAGLPEIAGVPSSPTRSLGDVVASARRVLAERETWLVSLVLFCEIGVNLTVLGLWGIPYVVQVYGLSVPAASTYALLGSVGLLVGPPAVGWLSDHLGVRTPLMVAGSAVYTAALALLALARPPLLAVGAIFFLLAFLSGAFALGYTVVKERHGAATSGVATGTVNAFGFAGAALFPTVMGAVLDAYWTGEQVAGARVYTPQGYRVAFGLAAGAGLVALAAAALLLRRERSTAAEGEPAVADPVD